MLRAALTGVLVVAAIGSTGAQARTHGYTRNEFKQVVVKRHQDLRVSAQDRRIIKRVLYGIPRPKSRRLARQYLYRIRREVRYYKTHLLPWCTWGPESGQERAPFDPKRYTEANPNSAAAGKYQFLDSTWRGLGGPSYGARYHIAAHAPPLKQEKMAHKYYSMSGGSPWVNC